ncbi:hypothetical protein [Robertmurraya sp. FSL R5-0851]|uniref:hypothetical protein n=1 Tax=Robertmurraya sp. FSL R5-0851 TaxID=2921584 RepID=UPI0030F744D8
MDWVIRNGTLNILVTMVSLIWCEIIQQVNLVSIVVACGVGYFIWSIQCILYLLVGIAKVN